MELNGVVVQVNDVVLKEDKEPLGVVEVVVVKVGGGRGGGGGSAADVVDETLHIRVGDDAVSSS